MSEKILVAIRKLVWSVSKPPKVGPITSPTLKPLPNSPDNILVTPNESGKPAFSAAVFISAIHGTTKGAIPIPNSASETPVNHKLLKKWYAKHTIRLGFQLFLIARINQDHLC